MLQWEVAQRTDYPQLQTSSLLVDNSLVNQPWFVLVIATLTCVEQNMLHQFKSSWSLSFWLSNMHLFAYAVAAAVSMEMETINE